MYLQTYFGGDFNSSTLYSALNTLLRIEKYFCSTFPSESAIISCLQSYSKSQN